MTRLLRLLLLTLFLAPGLAHAQISFDVADYEAWIGTTRELHTFGTYEPDPAVAQALIDLEGANQTWDFTAIDFDHESTGTQSYVALPANLPGAAEAQALGATMATVVEAADSTAWLYDRLETDAYYNIGLTYQEPGGTTVNNFYDTPWLGQVFPQTYGTSWSGTTSQTMTIAGFSITTNMQRDAVVDGYGTLITPAGAEPCLRYKFTVTVSTVGTATTTTVYSWTTRSGMGASISLLPSGDVAYASYTIEGSGNVSAPATAPTNLAPGAGSVVASVTPTLSGNAVSGAASYHVQVATDDTFADVVYEHIAVTATSQQTTMLGAGAGYAWRVRAENEGGSGPWSDTAHFTVEATNTALERSGALPEGFALHDAYPNPFNPATTLSFDLPRAATATLAVYDALGREVATVVSGRLAAGAYRFSWNADHLPGGLYFYRLQAGAFSATRSLILLK